MKLRVFTAFSGYDSQCLALDRLRRDFPHFDYELVGWSEIDKYAIQAHNALYPQWADRNFGDISKIDWSQVPDFDLFTYSSPCQDFSNAGQQRGGEEGSGTRSSLLWECRRAIVAKKPKYLLLENVAALLNSKHSKVFKRWDAELRQQGYYNYVALLNAKDYGVPQNRKRVFMLSRRDNVVYYFPKPFKLDKRLKDVLEESVDEKYNLSDKGIDYMNRTSSGGIKHGKGIRTLDDETCGTIMASAQSKIAGGCGLLKVGNLTRIFTPRECFRLMGVDDSDIDKIQVAGISNNQQYKLAGNSIVVDVLYYIFRQMFINDKDFEQ